MRSFADPALATMAEGLVGLGRLAEIAAQAPSLQASRANEAPLAARLKTIAEFPEGLKLLHGNGPGSVALARGMLEAVLNAFYAMGVAVPISDVVGAGMVGDSGLRERIEALRRQGGTFRQLGDVFEAVHAGLDRTTPASLRGPWLGALAAGMNERGPDDLAEDMMMAGRALHRLLVELQARHADLPSMPDASAELRQLETTWRASSQATARSRP